MSIREQYDAEVSERARIVLQAVVSKSTVNIWNAHAFLALDANRDDEITAAVERHLAPRLLPSTAGEGGAGAAGGPSGGPSGGPFHVLPAMMLLCRWEDRLSKATVERIREFFHSGCIDRGNTENHWLMHYTGSLLAAERWPSAQRMWNGLTAAAVAAEASRWILGMIRRSAAVGHHEYDSTGYIAEHVTPLIALEQFAANAEVREAARSMLTLHFTDMALEYFHGAWAGSHSREGYRVNTWTKSGTVRGFHYVYFGGEEFNSVDHIQGFVIPDLVTDYRPPAMVISMAFERNVPFVVRKTKAPRTIYRHVDREADPIRKYTYVSPSFALGSAQIGLPGAPAGPIDLTSWDLSWDGPKHDATIVSNHPYRDPGRFSAFLSVLPHAAERDIATGKPYLQWPDRLFGASPFERVFQHQGTAIVLYRIPAADRDPYVNLYLPKGLTWVEQGGWLCAEVTNHLRDGAAGFYLAVHIIGAYRWHEIREARSSSIMVQEGDLIDGWLLRIDDRNSGLILEAVERGDAGSFDEFVAGRVAAGVDTGRWVTHGIVRYVDAAGTQLEMHYDGPHLVAGEAVDYDAWPLYEAPWVEGRYGSGKIILKKDGERISVDLDVSSPLIPMRSVG